jgi:hypothetical protein
MKSADFSYACAGVAFVLTLGLTFWCELGSLPNAPWACVVVGAASCTYCVLLGAHQEKLERDRDGRTLPAG